MSPSSKPCAHASGSMRQVLGSVPAITPYVLRPLDFGCSAVWGLLRLRLRLGDSCLRVFWLVPGAWRPLRLPSLGCGIFCEARRTSCGGAGTRRSPLKCTGAALGCAGGADAGLAAGPLLLGVLGAARRAAVWSLRAAICGDWEDHWPAVRGAGLRALCAGAGLRTASAADVVVDSAGAV
jgi:hypothetical protein